MGNKAMGKLFADFGEFLTFMSVAVEQKHIDHQEFSGFVDNLTDAGPISRSCTG